MRLLYNLLTALFFSVVSFAQEPAIQKNIPGNLAHQEWGAFWIAPSLNPITRYGVFVFRKSFSLDAIPTSFIVHVSADNRYKLFVNGTPVSMGPARGDIQHWNFETIDLASILKKGSNTIAALVWNEGNYRPEAQLSLRTAFILQGNSQIEQVVNSNSSWKYREDSSYEPLKVVLTTYYVAGAGEKVDMARHLKNWEQADYQDDGWMAARETGHGIPKSILGGYGTPSEWLLVPASIPAMEDKFQRLQTVRASTGVTVADSFPAKKSPFTIAAHTSASLLLDQAFLTNAYFTILFSGGKNADLSITYAESLFSQYPHKGNRDEITAKKIMGREDRLVPDGSTGQTFTTLQWRTYRYVQIKVQTGDQPLTIDDCYGHYSGYPFQLNAQLETKDPFLQSLLVTGWRTARLCAMETYMDCPYYERLQYIGDSRIQALVSLYNSGDDRLVKNALDLMDHSRLPEGVTLSRHPSFTPQIIPTFSLWYIGMLHDYMMYGKDQDFIRNKLPGERQVIDYFRSYQQEDGSLKNVPYWLFTDWVNDNHWNSGAAPVGKDGCSAILDFQLLLAFQTAADLEIKSGMPELGKRYQDLANQLQNTIRGKYWDPSRQLFADRVEKDLFSQHANSLAILTGTLSGSEASVVAGKLINDTTLTTASIYFKYYLHQALIRAGRGDEYLNWLGIWKDNLKMGLTTWAEMSDINDSRSDCHAWGSSPNIELYRTLLGIDSDAPGFSVIRVEPHLGTITDIKGSMPHPKGAITVSYKRNNGKWQIAINLPPETSGYLVWQQKKYPLHAGINQWDW